MGQLDDVMDMPTTMVHTAEKSNQALWFGRMVSYTPDNSVDLCKILSIIMDFDVETRAFSNAFGISK